MKNLSKLHRIVLLVALCSAIAIAGAALAAGEVLTRSVVTSAGGQATVDGIEARSAVGQPVAGIITSEGNGGVCVGFICPGSGSTQGVPAITPTATPDESATPGTTPGSTGTPDPSVTPDASQTPGTTPTPDSTPGSTTTPGPGTTPTPNTTPDFGDDMDVYLPLIQNGN